MAATFFAASSLFAVGAATPAAPASVPPHPAGARERGIPLEDPTWIEARDGLTPESMILADLEALKRAPLP